MHIGIIDYHTPDVYLKTLYITQKVYRFILKQFPDEALGNCLV